MGLGGKKFAIGQQNIGGGRRVEQIRWIFRLERSEKVPIEFQRRSAPDVTSAEEEHYMNTQEEITLDLVQAGAQYASFCLLAARK